MINFHYETNFNALDSDVYESWLFSILSSENFLVGDLNFIFCDDAYLLKINQDFLDHDTYTDIITFDYTEGTTVSGDIFVSVERVMENALKYNVSILLELQRVMAHGVLHLMGYKDKLEKDIIVMRNKEEEKIKMFHVEQ